MTTSQLALLMKSIAPVFREFVAGALGPFEARLKDLEGRALVPGPAGRDGRDGVDGRDGAKGLDGGIGPEGPIGPAGPSGPMGSTGPAGERGPAGPSGQDAAPVTKAQILEALLEDSTLLDGAVKAYLQAHPPAPGRDGLDGRDGPPGPAGAPGRDGLPGVPGPVGAKGVDGRDGRDGLDGLRPEDVDFVFDAETRGLTLRFMREGQMLATVTKTLPGVQIYRGIWKDGTAYQVGDTVTWGGSQWFCKADTTAKPDEHSRDGVRAWQLCVKRGGEGKAGQKGDAGPQGPKGPAGAPGSGRWP